MLKAMAIIFLLVTIILANGLILGLFKPAIAVRWGTIKTRKKVLQIYVPAIIISFILLCVFSVVSTTPGERAAYAKQAAEEKLKAEQEAKKKTEAEAQKKADQKAKEEAAAQKKAAEEKAKADADAKTKADADAKKKADEEAAAKKQAEEQAKKDAQAKEAAAQPKDETAVVKDEVGAIVKKVRDNKGLRSIDVVDNLGLNDGTKIVTVKIKADDNLTNNLIRVGIQDDTTKMLEQIAKDKKISSVMFLWTFDLQDQYGNDSEDIITNIVVNRDVMDKINFKNFLYSDLPDVANKYWEHPAMSK